LIALFPAWLLWAPNAVWKLFDMFIGLIQAFIFALLTVLYFGMAGAGHDEHEEHADADDATAEKTREAEPELAA
jgi:F-type H+-transporting ATPase subunit a